MEKVVDIEVVIDETLKGVGEEFSPYQGSKFASTICGRYVREQMLYNYTKKGYIPSHKNETNKTMIKKVDFIEWVTSFYNKNVKTES